MQWFLAHGDKLLINLAVLLQLVAGSLPGPLAKYGPVVLAVAAALHTTVLPEPTPAATLPAPKA